MFLKNRRPPISGLLWATSISAAIVSAPTLMLSGHAIFVGDLGAMWLIVIFLGNLAFLPALGFGLLSLYCDKQNAKMFSAFFSSCAWVYTMFLLTAWVLAILYTAESHPHSHWAKWVLAYSVIVSVLVIFVDKEYRNSGNSVAYITTTTIAIYGAAGVASLMVVVNMTMLIGHSPPLHQFPSQQEAPPIVSGIARDRRDEIISSTVRRKRVEPVLSIDQCIEPTSARRYTHAGHQGKTASRMTRCEPITPAWEDWEIEILTSRVIEGHSIDSIAHALGRESTGILIKMQEIKLIPSLGNG
jgi:hypothetical protein